MTLTGSPEWFYGKAHAEWVPASIHKIEDKRERFIARFSPECLKEMNGQDLLQEVFSDSPSSMLRLLMFDNEFREFGAPGTYKYLGIVYQDYSNWKYKEGSKSIIVPQGIASDKAEYVRDQLLFCVDEIEKSGILATIKDYLDLQTRMEKVFFYKYPWVMKYFQMLFPQYFPGMYADKTLDRALYILGLPNHGSRLLNAGEISLFIRRCDVHNIIFSKIYADEWGWEEDTPPCENAKINYENSSKPVHAVNKEYYALKREDLEHQARDIDEQIETLHKPRRRQGVLGER